MGGLDKKRLVLVRNTVKSSTGEEIYYNGTGYFVTKDRVLTAAHVLFPALSCPSPFEVKVRLEESLSEGQPIWLVAEPEPVWVNQTLDAVLLKVVQPIHEVELPCWGNLGFEQNTKWNSTAYPWAAAQKTDDIWESKSSGLKGTVYVQGGGGQGLKELELGVEHESKEEWNGISGAPVFVGDELIGIIKSYKKGFEGKRLDAVPINQLLNDPEFQRALKSKWLSPLPQQFWTLTLISEKSDGEFSYRADSALERQKEMLNKIAGLPAETKLSVVKVIVTEALTEPTRFYEVVEAICAAPIMVVDVTDYQPAIMLLLGIRAVVRRGVTIAVTSTELDESSLSELPFNIQEAKLIYPKPNLEVADPRHPINRIGEAIVEGLKQLRGHPNYLDLPAYEAVRCPKSQVILPESNGQAGDAKSDRILMLCSFNDQYRKHWLYVSEKIMMTFKEVGRFLERMLDIASPRLVGQALYESIRWTPCCIVDWTHWRANVFFELGVRLACSDIGPVCLIEAEELLVPVEEDAPFLVQKNQLLKLLEPICYKRGGSLEPFFAALKRYHSFLGDGQENFKLDSAIPHNATYRRVINAYDWKQEAFSRPPHEELRASVEVQQGKDPQKDGFQALFATNAEFNLEIQRNGRERRIAAWYYFKNRYTWVEHKNNKELRQQLSVLTESVIQELGNQADPNYQRIYAEAVKLMNELDQL